MDRDFIVDALTEIIRMISYHLNTTADLTNENDDFDHFWDGINDQSGELIELRNKIYNKELLI